MGSGRVAGVGENLDPAWFVLESVSNLPPRAEYRRGANMSNQSLVFSLVTKTGSGIVSTQLLALLLP